MLSFAPSNFRRSTFCVRHSKVTRISTTTWLSKSSASLKPVKRNVNRHRSVGKAYVNDVVPFILIDRIDFQGSKNGSSSTTKKNEGDNSGSRKRALEQDSTNEHGAFMTWFMDTSGELGNDEFSEVIKDDIYINPLQYYLVRENQCRKISERFCSLQAATTNDDEEGSGGDNDEDDDLEVRFQFSSRSYRSRLFVDLGERRWLRIKLLWTKSLLSKHCHCFAFVIELK